ncbi:MAG: hypothetical protein ACTSRA_11825, partial [Promethearchaeota archaeon]
RYHYHISPVFVTGLPWTIPTITIIIILLVTSKLWLIRFRLLIYEKINRLFNRISNDSIVVSGGGDSTGDVDGVIAVGGDFFVLSDKIKVKLVGTIACDIIFIVFLIIFTLINDYMAFWLQSIFLFGLLVLGNGWEAQVWGLILSSKDLIRYMLDWLPCRDAGVLEENLLRLKHSAISSMIPVVGSFLSIALQGDSLLFFISRAGIGISEKSVKNK